MEPDGLIPKALAKLLGRSWKTSAAGYVSIVCGLIAGFSVASPGVLPDQVVAAATVIGPIVAGMGLRMSKDRDVTGVEKKPSVGPPLT